MRTFFIIALGLPEVLEENVHPILLSLGGYFSCLRFGELSSSFDDLPLAVLLAYMDDSGLVLIQQMAYVSGNC